MVSHVRIFISSTLDLESERDAVNDVINQIEGIPIRMELFTARSQTPEEVCIEEVSRCDLYIGIFGKRYGFVPTEDNPRHISVTQIEFEKARELEIPTLVFIHRDSVGRDSELQLFLDKISDFKRGVFRKTFDGVNELKYWALASLVFHLSKKMDTVEQREKLEEIAPYESLYRKYVKQICEFVDLKGIYQLRRIVQLKLEDIYVPLKLRKITALKDQGFELSIAEIEEASGLELALPTPFPFAIRGFVKKIPDISPEYQGASEISSEEELSEVISGNKRIVILGAPGSGKTTMLRHLAGDLIGDTESGLIPILVPLREYGRYLQEKSDPSILNYIEYYFRARGLQIPNGFFARHLSSGGCVVMFDGLDEVQNDSARITCASSIEEFAAFFGQDNNIVVSSRVPAYRLVPVSNFNHFIIQKLTLNQIKEFVSRWFEIVEGKEQSDECKRLISLLTNDAGLLSLSTNPLMLSLVCLVGLQGITMPRKRADLYDICVKTLLSSWEVKKGFQPVFSEPQRLEILKEIAYWFIEENRVVATEYEMLSFIRQMHSKASLSENQSQDLAVVALKQMTERSGLFIEREPNTYGFVHLGLRDYLAALYLAGIDNVKNMFDLHLRSKLHNMNYEQIIVLCSRCLAHQSLERASILVKEVLNSRTSFEEYIHLDLALASRCLFESGILYGVLADEIFNKMAYVLRNGSDAEIKLILPVLAEIDVELCDGFLSSLTPNLEPKVAVDVLDMLTFRGIMPEKCQFCDIALNLLKSEVLHNSKASSRASFVIGIWAARGSQRALSLAFEIIKEGGKLTPVCASVVVPLARTDQSIREKLLEIIDDSKKPDLRIFLLQTLFDVAPKEIEEKAISIANSTNEDAKLKEIAGKILGYKKLTEEEANKLRYEISAEYIESLLQKKDKLGDIDLGVIQMGGLYLTQELSEKILVELPEIFQTNRALAFRLIQVLDDAKDTYPSFSREIEAFIKNLSESGAQIGRRLVAYLLAEISSLEVADEKSILVELAEDKNEFFVARRGALNRLAQVGISEEDFERLLKLSDDMEVNSNLFSLLVHSQLNKEVLLRTLLEQIKKGDTELLYYLREIIKQSFNQ